MIDIKFPTVYKCHTHYATFELPEGCKECREEIEMKDKDYDKRSGIRKDAISSRIKEKEYEEYEVWVNSRQISSAMTRFTGYDRKPDDPVNEFIKATLRIPKPERKVEISEEEFIAACKKVSGRYGDIGHDVSSKALIKEIFGRD